MIHPHTKVAFISDAIGVGVVATEPIPKGTIVYVYDELEIVFAPDDPRLQDPRYREYLERYCFTDSDGSLVLCWDHGRYVNHCCQPSVLSIMNGCCIAIKDIAVGEELTEDYGVWRSPVTMPLVCDKAPCRGVLGKADNALIADWCDAQAKSAILQWREVAQPMLGSMTDEAIAELDTFVRTGTEYRSVRGLLSELRDDSDA